MKYIIMCGGQYGWKKPRQLTEIQGEPIVARTIRLLRQEGVEDIAISATDRRFARFGVPVITHENDYRNVGGKTSGSWANAGIPLYGVLPFILVPRRLLAFHLIRRFVPPRGELPEGRERVAWAIPSRGRLPGRRLPCVKGAVSGAD